MRRRAGQLDFADGSIMRMEKGGSYAMTGCEHPKGPKTPLKIKVGLWLGDIWAKLTPDRKGSEWTGEWMVVGNRGTVFWMSHRGGLMTLHVQNGSMWLQRQSGNKLVGKRWTVRAGQTATWPARGAPVIRRTGESRPQIKIFSPGNHGITHRATISVRGRATDRLGVWSLTINGKPVLIGVHGAWHTSVKLHRGANTITATVTDLAQHSSTTRRTVTYRTRG